MTARGEKDGLSWQDTTDILAAVLCSRSTVSVKKNHHRQVIVFNSVDILRLGRTKEKWWGALIVQVSLKHLIPITAYHASEAKVRSLRKES